MVFILKRFHKSWLWVTPLLIYSVGLLFFGILLVFIQRLPKSDDFVFQIQIQPFPTLFDWIQYRYETWSGRIFAETFVYIFSPLPLYFWKIVSLLLYALFSGYTFLYYALFTKKRSYIKDCLMMALALVLPLIMDTHVLMDGMLWVTGSMNYFWLAAFALVSFYPVAYFVIKKHAPHWAVTTVGLLCAVIAASSQEQVGAIATTLSLLFSGYVLFIVNKGRKFPIYLSSFTLVFVVAFLTGITAPGNHERLQAETLLRIPDFYTVPLLDHITYGYRWFIDALINHLGFLLVASWVLLLALFANKKHAQRLDRLDYAVMAILGISVLFICLRGYEAVSYWFNFYPTWKASPPHRSLIVLMPWTIALLTTLVAPIVLYRNSAKGALLSLLYGATAASTAIITLAPTVYASGLRTLYIPSIVLMFVVYILFDTTVDQNKKLGYIVFTAIVCLAASQYALFGYSHI